VSKRVKHVGVAYLIALAAILFSIAYVQLISEPICLIYSKTGFSCPTCGVTRMLTEIVTTFDLYQAFRYNPVMFVILPVLGILLIVQSISYIKYGKFTRNYDRILSAIAFIIVAFGILRNIPMLYWLLPTKI